ncbi:cytochrome b/b6 domain-containing protein [uncultured Rhodospira sp.]|uniref:cytochrome b n=1 Tax=uncultured Rhodospira sp. TaxID=1936189 RepID=UPI002619A30C|nr:cytochrome b/b6 domain-containing protein [uncultured Rhodospira sp.]
MSVLDTKARFGAVSVFNHWTLAVLTIGLLATGLLIAEVLPESARETLIPLHKQVGIVSAIVLVWMALWRWTQKTRPGPVAGTSAPEAMVRNAMHALLLVGTALLFVSGMMMSLLSGHEVSLLGLYTLAPIADDPSQAAVPHMVHTYVGWAMVVAVLLHAAVGVKHHLLDKDETFVRMLGRGA